MRSERSATLKECNIGQSFLLSKQDERLMEPNEPLAAWA